MPDGLIETAAKTTTPEDHRTYGVAAAEVIANCDQTNLGRVKVRLPWLPGYEPWARVAAPMAGLNSGAYFMPQVGDEVLVAFNRGEVLETYVVGSMWNGRNKTPVKSSTDAQSKWVLRTPKGHEIVFDDEALSITITTPNSGPHITLGKDKIEIAIDAQSTAAITFDTSGNIKLKATNSITLEAPTIDVNASQNATLGGSSSARIDGGGYCSIQASKIDIG
jgi:uncharacterized protein involved in type VI secretion and phage assembly